MTTREGMSTDETLKEIRYILGSLEDQYTCSDREMCDEVAGELRGLLSRAMREKIAEEVRAIG
jgi:hypothetical protein